MEISKDVFLFVIFYSFGFCSTVVLICVVTIQISFLRLCLRLKMYSFLCDTNHSFHILRTHNSSSLRTRSKHFNVLSICGCGGGLTPLKWIYQNYRRWISIQKAWQTDWIDPMEMEKTKSNNISVFLHVIHTLTQYNVFSATRVIWIDSFSRYSQHHRTRTHTSIEIVER